MFNKDSNGGEPRSSAATGDANLSVIAAGSKVIGDMECSGVLKIEGTVEGTIRGARQVLLGRQGVVKGDIETREAVVGGNVEGSIHALERVEIQGTAAVVGNIHTKTIVIREGGQINGAVRMDESPAMLQDHDEEDEVRPPAVAVVR
jgi:cytoskeletal protein CcmA (bactofilin family)